MQPLTPRDLVRHLGALVLGGVVGLVGTGVHRVSAPWGLVLALAAVVCAGVLVRAWIGWTGLLAVALGTFGVVALLAGRGPGGDVLVALDWLGVVWYCGGAAVVLAALLPRSWFTDRQVGGTASS